MTADLLPVAGWRLVLASASPARLATLRAAGVDPLVQVSAVDEALLLERSGVSDPEYVPLLLARAKAEDVAAALDRRDQDLDDDEIDDDDEDDPSQPRRDHARSHAADGSNEGQDEDQDGDDDLDPGSEDDEEPGWIVLGCDSILDLDGEALGKPGDPAEAVRRWQRMRGRSGVLRTGHWLIDLRSAAAGGTRGAVGAVSATTVHFANVSDAEIEAYVATGEPLQVAGAFTVDGLGGAFVSGLDGDPHGVVGVSLPLLRDLLAQLDVSWTALWNQALAAGRPVPTR